MNTEDPAASCGQSMSGPDAARSQELREDEVLSSSPYALRFAAIKFLLIRCRLPFLYLYFYLDSKSKKSAPNSVP